MALDAALKHTFATALGTVEVTANPLAAGMKLAELLQSLQHAAETAEQCEGICRRVVERAISRAPIICELLTAGNLYPDENVRLNRALNATLCMTIHALEEACDSLYEFMQRRTLSQWMNAETLKEDMEKKRELLFDRLDDVQAHVQLATYKQVAKGVAVVAETELSLKRAVEGLQSDLEALQSLGAADRERVRALARARVKRKRPQGQKVNVTAELRLESLELSPDCSRFACVCYGEGVEVRDSATCTRLFQLLDGQSIVWSAAWSPDAATIATCDGDGAVRLWNSSTGAFVREVPGTSDSRVVFVAWSTDMAMFAIGTRDGTVKLLDATTDTLMHALEGHTAWVRSVAWSPDGRMLATGSHDNTGVCEATRSSDGTMRLWDSSTGAVVRVLQHTGVVRSAAWSPDGGTVATAAFDTEFDLWNSTTGACVRVPTGHTRPINAVAWSPGGSTIATASQDHTVRLLDSTTHACVRVLEGHTGAVTFVAWHVSGREVFTGSWDGTVRIYSVKVGERNSE